jgi:DNA (cytosine-5)-methyltransferase 1
MITVGEFFSGAGGMALGSILAKGFSYKWVVDKDKDACDTFMQNINGWGKQKCKVLCSDVADVDVCKLAKVDCLVFGFPCNDYSRIGSRQGSVGSYGRLHLYPLKYIREHRPSCIIAENVPEFVNSNSGVPFRYLCSQLSKLGYNVSHHIVHFEDYSVPQYRHRLIIFGTLKDGCQLVLPVGNAPLITCKDALENPPIAMNARNHEMSVHTQRTKAILKSIKPGSNIWSIESPRKTQKQFGITFRRMAPDRPAFTITASGGGGTLGYHYAEPRALTNRERARIQTFPDKFVFSGTRESVRKQIGMAVPPQGAKVVFECVKKCIGVTSVHCTPRTPCR